MKAFAPLGVVAVLGCVAVVLALPRLALVVTVRSREDVGGAVIGMVVDTLTVVGIATIVVLVCVGNFSLEKSKLLKRIDDCLSESFEAVEETFEKLTNATKSISEQINEMPRDNRFRSFNDSFAHRFTQLSFVSREPKMARI